MVVIVGICLLTEAEASARNGSSLDSGNGVLGSEFSGSVEPSVNSGGGAGLDFTRLLGSGGSGGGADVAAVKLTRLKSSSKPSWELVSGSCDISTSCAKFWLLGPLGRVDGNAGTGGGGLLGGACEALGIGKTLSNSGSSSFEMSRRLVAECMIFLFGSSFLAYLASLKSFRLELDRALWSGLFGFASSLRLPPCMLWNIVEVVWRWEGTWNMSSSFI